MKNEVYKAIKQKKIKALTQLLFRFTPTQKQQEIIKTIAYAEHKRTVISCMTRYGKTRCVAIGVCLYILLHKNKRILLISPTMDQTRIIRNYIAEHITSCPIFNNLLDLSVTGIEGLKKEVSKKRLTFKNNDELIALSAEGTGERLMGHGGDLVIIDESCLINYEVYRSKISRTLGDNPNSILIEIGNPWHRDNQMYDHWINPDFKKIHVGWKKALQEGRITQSFLDEQKKDLTPIEWCVLYESKFPEESEDSIFKFSEIQSSINKWKDIPSTDFIISADIADKGMDKTVIMKGKLHKNNYLIESIYSEAKSEQTDVAGRIIKETEEHNTTIINVDSIGIGTGIVSMIKEGLQNKKIRVTPCHFGKKANDNTRFLNKKAEMYFRLKKLFENGMISIPNNKELIKELMSMKWEHTSAGKIRIIDPDKSPDFADALVYFVWKQNKGSYAIA